MGRITAISSGDLDSTKSIHQYAVRMLPEASRNVLFIGTASRDAAGYIESITALFSEMGCNVRALQLAAQTPCGEEIRKALSWADLIYIGGGDTLFMMNTWKKYGLDVLLKEVYEKDTALLMGISAGAICWFACGCTDSPLAEIPEGASYGWANDMLDLHHAAFCPHYEDRTGDFELLMKDQSIPALALESNTAFVEENGKITFLKSRENAKAYLLRSENGSILKEELSLIPVY